MMNYDEFKEYVIENILNYFPTEDQELNVTIQQVIKNNDTKLDGLQVRGERTLIAPVVYLNGAYENYKSGEDLDQITGSLADTIIAARKPDIPLDISGISDYENVKDRIVCRLVNREENIVRLSDAPYTEFEDLAVTYHIMMSHDEDGIASILISNNIMDSYGIDKDTLHQQAMDNMSVLTPPKFESLNSIMMEMMVPNFMEENGMSEEIAREMVSEMLSGGESMPLYCLTTEDKINGAVCIVNPEVQEMVSERLGGDFYVLPSSVHEVLVLPKDGEQSYEELQEMVQEVNSTQVAEDEKLSDHVYQYDSKTHCLSRADKGQKQDYKLAAVQEENHTYDSGTKEVEHTQEPEKHNSPRH